METKGIVVMDFVERWTITTSRTAKGIGFALSVVAVVLSVVSRKRSPCEKRARGQVVVVEHNWVAR